MALFWIRFAAVVAAGFIIVSSIYSTSVTDLPTWAYGALQASNGLMGALLGVLIERSSRSSTMRVRAAAGIRHLFDQTQKLRAVRLRIGFMRIKASEVGKEGVDPGRLEEWLESVESELSMIEETVDTDAANWNDLSPGVLEEEIRALRQRRTTFLGTESEVSDAG